MNPSSKMLKMTTKTQISIPPIKVEKLTRLMKTKTKMKMKYQL